MLYKIIFVMMFVTSIMNTFSSVIGVSSPEEGK